MKVYIFVQNDKSQTLTNSSVKSKNSCRKTLHECQLNQNVILIADTRKVLLLRNFCCFKELKFCVKLYMIYFRRPLLTPRSHVEQLYDGWMPFIGLLMDY